MLDGLGNVLHIHRAFNESLQALRHADHRLDQSLDQSLDQHPDQFLDQFLDQHGMGKNEDAQQSQE